MFWTMFVYNLLVCLALLSLVGKNPRYMMQDYPPEITAGIPAQTAEEKRAGMLYGLPFLLVLIGFPLVFGFVNKFSGGAGFLENWLALFTLMFSFNLVDLVILDWIIFCWLTPSFMVLPGTEGHPGYKNYRFHFIGFLKGTLIVLVASLLISGLTEVVFALANIFR
jgi:hypothetical protein